MDDQEQVQGLSESERAELEQLRAEKARAEAQAQADAERAELERLRAEAAQAKAQEEADAHAREVAERNRKIMEPDDDLNMPFAQKLVLVVLAVLVVVAVVYIVTNP